MERSAERRHPERHLFLLRFLRRLTLLALFLSAGLWALPRVLIEYGVIGPPTQAHVLEAEQKLLAARGYGAGSEIPQFAAAEQHLRRARSLASAGDDREARREAAAAGAQATEAQKAALVRRTQLRQRAEAIYKDLDTHVEDLEKLYTSVATGLQKAETEELRSVMKVTRQSTGLVFLAYEKEQFDSVLAGEAKAREAIAWARQRLTAPRH